MTIYELKDLFSLAKNQSPYYKELYRSVDTFRALQDLPVVDQKDFWNANTVHENNLLTEKMRDGIVFKSGGTTGNAKFSVFTRDEWNSFTSIFGQGMSKSSLSAGDRIANLFYAGELYASFIFIMKSIEAATVPVMQFPISGATKAETTLSLVEEYGINALAGLPTTIMSIAEHYAEKRHLYPQLEISKILFGGESMYPDQRKLLHSLFPSVQILSIGYASVDAGLLGYADATCGPDEHRCFGTATVLEIIDEDTGDVIEETGKAGKLLVTNLTRRLLPIIRYPAGDRVMWLEPLSTENPDRKFVILGRSEEAARIGPVSIYYDDMASVLNKTKLQGSLAAFQLIANHFELKDALTVKIAIAAGADLDLKQIAKEVTDLFCAERPMFAQSVATGIIHPLTVNCVSAREIEVNSRTGKLRRVIDSRQAIDQKQ